LLFLRNLKYFQNNLKNTIQFFATIKLYPIFVYRYNFAANHQYTSCQNLQTTLHTMRAFQVWLTAPQILHLISIGIDALPVVDESVKIGNDPSKEDIEVYNLWIIKKLITFDERKGKTGVAPFGIEYMQHLTKYTLEQVLFNFLDCGFEYFSRLDFIFKGQIPSVKFIELHPTIQKGIRAYQGFDNFCMNNPAFQEWVGVERTFAPSPAECSYEVFLSKEGDVLLKIKGNIQQFYESHRKGYVRVGSNRNLFIVESQQEGERIGKQFVQLFNAIHFAKERLIFEADSQTENMVFAAESYISIDIISKKRKQVHFEPDIYGNKSELLYYISGFKIANPIEEMAYLKAFKAASEHSWIAKLNCIDQAMKRLGIGYQYVSNDIWIFAETNEYAKELINAAAKQAQEIRASELTEIEMKIEGDLNKMLEDAFFSISDVKVKVSDKQEMDGMNNRNAFVEVRFTIQALQEKKEQSAQFEVSQYPSIYETAIGFIKEMGGWDMLIDLSGFNSKFFNEDDDFETEPFDNEF